MVLQSELQVNGEKEHHWKNELSHLSAQLELSQQKVFELDNNLSRNEREIDALEGKLRNSQRMEDLARVEVRMGGREGWDGRNSGRGQLSRRILCCYCFLGILCPDWPNIFLSWVSGNTRCHFMDLWWLFLLWLCIIPRRKRKLLSSVISPYLVYSRHLMCVASSSKALT